MWKKGKEEKDAGKKRLGVFSPSPPRKGDDTRAGQAKRGGKKDEEFTTSPLFFYCSAGETNGTRDEGWEKKEGGGKGSTPVAPAAYSMAPEMRKKKEGEGGKKKSPTISLPRNEEV